MGSKCDEKLFNTNNTKARKSTWRCSAFLKWIYLCGFRTYEGYRFFRVFWRYFEKLAVTIITVIVTIPVTKKYSKTQKSLINLVKTLTRSFFKFFTGFSGILESFCGFFSISLVFFESYRWFLESILSILCEFFEFFYDGVI
jgi:hypothetical protein